MTNDYDSNANVVIIGGGIAGVSTAAYLAQRGVKNIILVEMEKLIATKETAASAAMLMFNTHRGDLRLIQLAASAMREYHNMKSILGIDPEIKQCGSILISTTPEGKASMQEQVSQQNAYGIPSKFVSVEEIQELVPFLNVEGILSGIYCPVDGYVNQIALVGKLKEYAQAKGVKFWFDSAVTNITADSEGIVNVQTNSRGLIPAKEVIIAAGAQSPELVESFGKYPLEFSTRTLWDTSVQHDLSTPLRIIEYVDGPWQGYYFRPEEGGKKCIIGVGPTRENNHFPTGPQIPFNREETSEFMNINFPGLKIGELTGTVYPRAMGPNGLPYVGPIDREGRLIAFYGGSGYGITFSPFLAKNLTHFIEGRINRETESSLLTMERFNTPSRIEWG